MKTKKTAYVEVRLQKASGSWPRQGPDTYVMVQVVPDGIVPLRALNREHARARGIELIYCGEGYESRQKTTRSMLGAALAKAREITKEINKQRIEEEAKEESWIEEEAKEESL